MTILITRVSKYVMAGNMGQENGNGIVNHGIYNFTYD